MFDFVSFYKIFEIEKNAKQKCIHTQNTRTKIFYDNNGAPFMEFECYDCGYSNDRYLHRDSIKEELIIIQDGKIIVNEPLKKKTK